MPNTIIIYITKPILIQNFNKEFKQYYNDNSKIICLTPFASYLLDIKNIEYLNMHNIIDQKTIQEKSLILLKDLDKFSNSINSDNIFNNYLHKNYILLSYLIRNNLLSRKIIDQNKNLILMTDVAYKDDLNYESKLDNSFFYLNSIKFNKIIYLKQQQINAKLNKYKKLQAIFNRSIYLKVINKILKQNLSYDWIYFILFILKNKKIIPFDKYDILVKNDFLQDTGFINKYDIDTNKFKVMIDLQLKNLLDKSHSDTISNFELSTMHIGDKIVNDYQFYKNKNKHFIWQHGSYFYKGTFIKYFEINYDKINFVFNDYTKKLFEDLGAKKVYSVGSLMLNESIKEKKKKYDFLYITQGHDYMGNLQYVDFSNSLHSFDGYELYRRHKNIIELFGIKFSDKKILIRVHPCVVTTGVYVPFWELSEQYSNITVDVSIPIHTLIEKSKYIISDYFTTEFINRELHYKRDIILFQGAPTPLPEETIEDMEKMFILVDTVDDLENKVKNIESTTKNRKRYDDIIEYYSSKKCDTKKVVTEILEKELNGR